MKDKLNNISKVNDDIKYLRDEYKRVKMWGSPNGDLEFETLMDWLNNDDNAYMMEYMIKTAKLIKTL